MSVSRASFGDLPSETLIKIFTFAVGDSPCAIQDQDRHDALLNIPLVCIQWNHVSTSIRSLWSHIDLHVSLASVVGDPDFELSRIRLWLDRSRGLPVHIHFPEGGWFIRRDLLPKLVSVLKPHIPFLSSLKLYISGNSAGPYLTDSLLSLFSINGSSIPLQALVLSEICEYEPTRAIVWPENPLAALTEIDLYKLEYWACPSLVDLVPMISNCPALQTLRLRELKFRAYVNKIYPMIRLPSLRLLEIVCLGTLPVAARLLSLLFPGTHELNIRLDLASTGGENQNNETCALLERSNPVSLALSSISSWNRGHRIHSYLVRTPNLRTLLINLDQAKGLHALGELLTRIDSDLLRRLPYLRALCIVGGRVELHSMMQLQCFVAIANLHYLVFLDCLFEVESPDDRPCGSNKHEENQGEEEEQLPLYVAEMPGVVKEWVPDKVGNVLFYESAPERTCQNLDLFIENLLKLDQDV